MDLLMKKSFLGLAIIVGWLVVQTPVDAQPKKAKKPAIGEAGRPRTTETKSSATSKVAPPSKKSTASMKAKNTRPDLPPPPPIDKEAPVTSDKGVNKVINKPHNAKTVPSAPTVAPDAKNAGGANDKLKTDQKKSDPPAKDKVVGRTPDGTMIYEAPNGIRYALDKNGRRTYLKKKR